MDVDDPSASSAPLPVTVEAQLQNARFLLHFLKALHFKDDVTLILGGHGLKVTVEDSKSFQANAYIQRALFRKFDLSGGARREGEQEEEDAREPEVSFRLSMGSLVECLGLFGHHSGSAPALCLRYEEGEPLRLWLEEGGVVTEVRARTRVALEVLDFDFQKSVVAAKVILQADRLKEVLADLDLSGEHVEVRVDGGGEGGELRLSTTGALGEVEVSIPGESPIISHFSVEDNTSGARYKTSLFRHALRPVSLAEKVSLRIDRRGVLCLQYMVKVEDQKSFIEFFCLPDGQDAAG